MSVFLLADFCSPFVVSLHHITFSALQDFAGYPPDLGGDGGVKLRLKKPPFVSFGGKLARKQLETAFFRLFS